MHDVKGKVCPRCGTLYDVAATFCQLDGAALVQALDETDPYIGRTLLDQFRIEARLGAGGMGTVYRAHQLGIGRDVAVKILHPDLTQNPDAVRRFQREARVSASLDHPNVVRVFLFGQLPDDSLYLVMEYLRGQSLWERLRSQGALDPSAALHIATQICDGVGEAHRHGVVHRDVKPENVLLVRRGNDPDFVKVLDFGVARFVHGEQTVATQTGLIFGTARYISPEGAQGEHTDSRSDVYSIAVLTYQLLCGETPFDAASPVGLLMRHIHDVPQDLRRRPLGAHVPGEVADVIMRSLSKNPDARPTDGNELGGALRAAAVASGIDLLTPRYSSPPSAPPPGLPAPRPAPVGRRLPLLRGTSTSSTGPMAVAPSPFGDPSALSLEDRRPPLPRRRVGPVGTVLLAFVLGAGAVIGGAHGIAWLAQGSDSVSVEDLEARARAALARGDVDTPPGDNVADLTARILERRPDHAGALALREQAAERLRLEGRTARAQGYLDEARSRYRRALALVPDHAVTRDALAEIERAASAPTERRVAGIQIDPDEPHAGETLTLVAVLPEGEEPRADAAPHFHIERSGRRLSPTIATQPDGEGRHAGTYRFTGHGTFDLVFMIGSEVKLRREIDVAPARSAARRRIPPATTQGAARPRTEPALSVDPADGESIDWRLPGERRDPPPAPPAAPPAAPAPAAPAPPEPSPPAPEPTPPPPWSSGDLL